MQFQSLSSDNGIDGISSYSRSSGRRCKPRIGCRKVGEGRGQDRRGQEEIRYLVQTMV